jgi:peptidyl-dipeptidase A
MRRAVVAMAACLGLAWPAIAAADGDVLMRAKTFIAEHEANVRPMEIEVGKRWWTASITGAEDDFQKKQEAETALELRLADPKAFAELKAIRQAAVSDPLVARQIDVLYFQYASRQIDPELLKQMLAKSNAIEKAFNVYRPTVGGKKITDNEVRRILRESNDAAKCREAWEASKGVGVVVERDLKALIRLRNKAAKQLGFADYHEMQLALNEQKRGDVLKLFDDLDALTRDRYHELKTEIDKLLAARFKIPVEQLQPWHYQDPFFQEPPAVFGGDFAAVYSSVDVPKVCRAFYDGIGLPIGDVLKRSDLFEKPGKSPHAFCIDIDREGDVRVLTNIVPDRMWLSTLLHELGHATYTSKNIPASVPYVLRTEAHTLTTEGVAMMFERFVDQAEWLQAMGIDVPDAKAFNASAMRLRRAKLLVFSRWCQVMFRFEKELYGDPDQDLNALWWRLVAKYQEMKCPEGRDAPDYGSKLHVVAAPAYYHNYLMGELFAAQLHRAIVSNALHSTDPNAIYVGNKAVGEFMKSKVYAPGRTLEWNEMIRQATGEPLSPKAFADSLVPVEK